MKEIPKAVWSGEISILGIIVHCYILDDGQRIIDMEDAAKIFKAMGDGETMTISEIGLKQLAQFLKGST